MKDGQKWPEVLWIVRHGQSAGNLARDAAEAAGRPHIGLEVREMDVPLSPLGEQQARALGTWFAGQAAERPTLVLSSPYLRARETARLVLEAAGLGDGAPLVIDERLREREMGIVDGLTRIGIEALHPEQAELMTRLRKFYHRPPGGESWCDIILRLRSLVEMLAREHCGERVLLVCHSVVVLCFRYLLERMTEEQVLEIDRHNDVANCSVTSYRFDPGRGRAGELALTRFNFVAPLTEAGAPVTRQEDEGEIKK